MTSVPPLPPYKPRKPKRRRLRRLQSRMRLRRPLLLMLTICRQKRQPKLNQVHHSSRHLPQHRPGHPVHGQFHLNHRSPPQPQVHITPITHTTIPLIHMRPTIPLLTRRTATLTLRILNLPQCTRSIRRATLRHCSPIRHLSTLPILLRNRLTRSVVLTIFQVMRR